MVGKGIILIFCIALVPVAVLAAEPQDGKQWRKTAVRLPSKGFPDADRIQAACDVAVYLNDDLKKQKNPTKEVVEDASELQALLCPGMPKK